MNRPLDSKGPLRWYLSFVKPYGWQLLLATITGVLKYNLPVIFPWLMKEFVDAIVEGRQTSVGLSTDALMIGALVLFLAYGFVVYLRTHFADRLAEKIMCDVRKDLHQHITHLPMKFFHSTHQGMLTSRLITDAMMAQNFIGLAGVNFLMEITSVLAITCMLFAMNVKLAIVALCSMPMYVLMHKLLGNRNRNRALALRGRVEELESDLHESLQGITETKSYTREASESARIGERCERVRTASFARIHASASLLGMTALLTRIPTVLVIWYSGRLIGGKELTVGELLAFYAYLELVYNPLTRLSDLNVLLANSLAAIERLHQLRSEPVEEFKVNAAHLAVDEGRIEFDDLCFRYAGTSVFRGLQLTVEAGETVAIVGPSGAGKSTLVKLLQRFCSPQHGSIRIDGVAISEVSLPSLRSNIAVVQQDVFLFDASIEDNIRFGNAEAPTAEVVEAARNANAWEFISQQPLGLKTTVGSRGCRLSGGQKQRISLARAFLRDAPILVFDESTSNLDDQSEREVCHAIERLTSGRTTIIISHRPAALCHVDRVIELRDGKAHEHSQHSWIRSDVHPPLDVNQGISESC